VFLCLSRIFSKIKKEFDGGDAEKLATIVGHVLGDGGISKGKFYIIVIQRSF
jgi:hypothetical protein